MFQQPFSLQQIAMVTENHRYFRQASCFLVMVFALHSMSLTTPVSYFQFQRARVCNLSIQRARECVLVTLVVMVCDLQTQQVRVYVLSNVQVMMYDLSTRRARVYVPL